MTSSHRRLISRALLAVSLVSALALIAACSSEEGSKSDPGAGGSSGPASGGASSGGGNAGGANSGGGNAGGASAGGTGGAVVVPDAGFNAALDLKAYGSNGTNGLEWNAIEGAESYRLYFSTGASVSQADTSVTVSAPRLTHVHRALTNGTLYRYIVTAVIGGSESAPSNEATATPTGEWVLEEFGSGSIEDITTGAQAPRIPIAQRLHLLLFAEGYTAADLPTLHDHADHDGERQNDVDRWTDLVFSIEPYTAFREAFVVWYLPRASNTDINGGDTAFMVPLDGVGVGNFGDSPELASRAWAAIGEHMFPPTDFSGGGFGSARNHVASFLMFDPERGRAGVSGRAGGLENPADGERISAAFGVGHAHEFTHAFSGLRDEYLEDDNNAPGNWSGTSNVVGTNQCAELPWAHLLSGGAFNPTTAELVGAFGVPAIGYHSELLCLLNGTHDNAVYYGGDGLLRVEDRMCNFCRETTAFRIYQRGGLLENDDPGFDAWVSSYRAAFYERFGFAIPEVVPQTNDPRDQAAGEPVYEACSAARKAPAASKRVAPASGTRASGCIIEN